MKLPIKMSLFVAISLVFSHASTAQKVSTVELKGRVVEMVNGKATGIPKVTVSVTDTDYDITEADGSFSINLRPEQKHVKVSLDVTNKQLLSPFEGIVTLPPSGTVDILVCAQQNLELKNKVVALNTKVKNLQQKFNLSQRQTEYLQRQMLDTVMYFEQRIQDMKASFEREKTTQQAEQQKAMQERDAKIQRLETELQSIMQQLVQAKDAQFLKKQAAFQSISSALRHYNDALQNLRPMILPDRIPQYFSGNAQAGQEYNRKVADYNTARETLVKQQDAHLTAVQHYWTNPSVPAQLSETYQYIFDDVHDKIVYPINSGVGNALEKFLTRQMGRQEAQKKAVKAATDSYSRLTVILPILDEKIQSTINTLKQEF